MCMCMCVCMCACVCVCVCACVYVYVCVCVTNKPAQSYLRGAQKEALGVTLGTRSVPPHPVSSRVAHRRGGTLFWQMCATSPSTARTGLVSIAFNTCTHARTHINIHTYTHTYTHIHIHIYTHIHTYTHIYTYT